jgi:nicotinamidase-related amidase
MISLPSKATALVLIDLQKGIVGIPAAPHDPAAVVERGKALAQRFRTAGSPVILVNVAFSKDFGDALQLPVDKPFDTSGMPDNWTELVDGLPEPADLTVTKRHWNAFYGTDLDLQLRRRGIKTIVLGGISTNIGVEGTARAAHEHGYAVVFAEDVTTAHNEAMHGFAFTHIFPRLGRVAKADDIELQ